MAVITISRELGSNGASIGQQVAKTLGYSFVDKDTMERVFRQYGLTRFEDIYSSAPSIMDMFNYNSLLTIAMFNEILEALAQRGNVVILGRGGFAVLGDFADVLDVRLEAKLAVRTQRIMQRERLSTEDQAQARINEDDSIRRKFVQMFYNRQWNDPTAFDLIIDTGLVSEDQAIQQIVEAARKLEQGVSKTSAKATAALEIDPVLADAIEQVMVYPAFSTAPAEA